MTDERNNVMRIDGRIYEFSNTPELVRWNRKGFSTVLRQLQPGQQVTIPTAQASAGKLARRIFGRGNYRTCRAEEGGTTVWRKL